jgi:predicted MFS family arabinose efflux permease
MAFWVLIAVAVAAVALTVLLMPRAKTPKPEMAKDLDDPTAEAGKPIPVVFGTITVKGLNVLWFGEKRSRTYKVDA